MRTFRGAGLVLVLSLVAACQGAGTPVTVDGVTLLRYGSTTDSRTGLYEGTLQFRSGCTWVDSTGASALVLWPPAAGLERVADRLHVVVGEVSMADGDVVSLGGGLYRDRGEVEKLVGTVPPSCVADMYWLATGVNSRSLQ